MNDETESDARKERLAEEADARIKSGAHWTDWMYIADGIAVGQSKAMRDTGTNKPYGRAFTRAFGDWLKTRPWANRYDKGTRSNLLWAVDHRSEIEAWRDMLAQNERDKMNHPTVLRRRFEAAHKVAAVNPDTPKKETGKEALVRENTDLWAKVKNLEHQIEAGDGSLFDLRKDSIQSIVNVIAGSIPLGRFISLQRAMTEKLAELKSADKAKHAKAG